MRPIGLHYPETRRREQGSKMSASITIIVCIGLVFGNFIQAAGTQDWSAATVHSWFQVVALFVVWINHKFFAP